MRSIVSGASRCLLVLAAAAALTTTVPAPAWAGPVAHHQLVCLNGDVAGQLRQDPEQTIRRLLAGCDRELTDALGERFSDLSPHARHAIIAALAAHRAAGYGGSTTYTLNGLLHAPALDCAGYAALTWHLLRLAGDRLDDLHILGWDGTNAVGNHAQMALQGDGQALIVDPTVGVVARADYLAVTNGAPVDPDDIVVFDLPDLEPDLEVLTDQVVNALYTGAFNPTNAIYDQPYPPGQGALAA